MINSDQIAVELQESMGNDFSIANSAWTSSTDYQKKKTKTKEEVKRVVEMLANFKHSVPFESVVLRFWIKMPIQTDRQFMTHRIASHSGMSGRYRTMPHEYLQIPGDVSDVLFNAFNHTEAIHAEEQYEKLCDETNSYYRKLLADLKLSETEGKITNNEYKRVREFYRGMLPQNNMVERVTIMNLRSFANFIKLRLKPEAQPEIQKVAELMLAEVKKNNIAPVAIEWLEKNGWNI